MKLCVGAIVATYHRPRELARLLESLARLPHGLALTVIVDNSCCAETAAVVVAAPCRTRLLVPTENLGCGGGLRLAGEEVLRELGADCTHLLVLDDDAILPPETLELLAAALEREAAVAAYPLVVNGDGEVGWVPGLADVPLQRAARKLKTPALLQARFGARVANFNWAQGVCLLVARRAIDAVGLHRADFWVRGEDLDFSLRLTAFGRGIFVPQVVVQHCPPAESAAQNRAAEYFKSCALVQNVAYVSTLPHGRRIAWTIPHNIAHLLRIWGLRAIPDAARAWWRGAMRKEPAGEGGGATFLSRFNALH